MSSLLACPLCSHPGFETLESLQYNLISATTRQIVCPVCHDVLYGLDKFTIHLFSHSVQHQEASKFLSVQRLNHAVNQVPNKLLICTQSTVIPVTNEHHYLEKNLTNVQNCITVGENLKLNKVENGVTYKRDSLKNRCFQNPINIGNVWKEYHESNKNCDDRYCQIRKEDDMHTGTSVQKTVDTFLVSSLEPLKESHVEGKSTKDTAEYSTNVNKTHEMSVSQQNVSVQCSESQCDQPSSSDKTSLKVMVKETVKCDICGFTFNDSSILSIHNQLVHSAICDKDIANSKMHSSKVYKQERILDEKRQYPCHLCSKAFKMRGSLMVHLRVVHSSIIATGMYCVFVCKTIKLYVLDTTAT